MTRPKEPFLWALFSGGGMLAALLLPVLAALVLVAMPLGFPEPVSHASIHELASHPLTRLALFPLATLCFFHGAHRFRYTLYDGMQLYHLNTLIAVLTYGTASLPSGAAAVVLWSAG
jgi:fumarate reductase subunit D